MSEPTVREAAQDPIETIPIEQTDTVIVHERERIDAWIQTDTIVELEAWA